jgi:ParB family chromosome partitioning protein
VDLQHIPFAKLKVSKTNMRYLDPEPDISDILPSIRQKGVLQPLIVRPEDGKFGIVAGRRRYFSLKAVKAELGEVADPPCAVMAEGDDAEAIEASLLENVARRDPDPMREYETFVRLIGQGRTVDGIAATTGLTTAQVKQRLALGNLLPKIREAYRAEEIDDETVRHLTLASVAQQRKWLRLLNDPGGYAPRGFQLKQWLFGGQQIATARALFKLTDYTGQIIEDLFGEERYFADADLFWALQNRAIAAKRDTLLKAGWSHVTVLEIGQRFQQYEHVRTPKKKGGKVFVTVSHDGAVEIFDGWLTQKEARKAQKAGDKSASAPRGVSVAMTQGLQNYIELHRHAAVRAALIGNPHVALRLTVAHMAAPSGNWNVKADPGRANSDAIRASVENSPAHAAFGAEEQEVHALLGWSEDDIGYCETGRVFQRLLELSDAEVVRIATFFMAASLHVGSDVVDIAGETVGVDPRDTWHADDVFFDLIRDRVTVNALVADVAGEATAKANFVEKTRVQKDIVRDCLAGANGRAKVEGWLPGWLAFPARPVGGTTEVSEPQSERIADAA